LYTTGIQDGEHNPKPDSKLNITMQFNDKTKLIKRGIRLLLGFSGVYYAYKTTLPDIVNRPGLIDIVLVEDDICPEDDIINGIAFNDISISTSTTNLFIEGVDDIKVNEQQIYKIINNNGDSYSWSVTTLNGTFTSYAKILNSTITNCTVQGLAGVILPQQVKLTARNIRDTRIYVTKIINVQNVF
jgi:hypothetical protein